MTPFEVWPHPEEKEGLKKILKEKTVNKDSHYDFDNDMEKHYELSQLLGKGGDIEEKNIASHEFQTSVLEKITGLEKKSKKLDDQIKSGDGDYDTEKEKDIIESEIKKLREVHYPSSNYFQN